MKFAHRHRLSIAVAASLAIGAAAQSVSDLGPVVDVGYAAFAGNATSPAGEPHGPVTFFGSIPYAQPPLGKLRFRGPQPLNEKTRWKQVTDARNFGPACIQQPAVAGTGSEDCLNLNIWKPSNATSGQKLPVMVYIHGGGFMNGNPQGFPLYDWVAQHPGGIIGVSVTYRLNLFGFLGGSILAANGDLNRGLLDQRAALEWVQRHIRGFGGDPDNVTLVGESAGGASGVMQAAAYGGTKAAPFKRVISQSIGFGPTPTTEQVESTFKNVTLALGCPYGTKDNIPCLQKAPISAIENVIANTPVREFVPVVEGPTGFLPALPSQLISAGKFSTVDFIGGHCTNDGKTWVGGKPEQFVTDDDIRRLTFAARWTSVTNATIEKALKLYPAPDVPGSPFATQYDRAAEITQDIVFSCMDTFFAQKMLARKSNVFSYRWNAPDPVLLGTQPYLGVMHTSDLYYLFDGTNTAPNAGFSFTPFNATEAALSQEAIAYWTSFGYSGAPSTTRMRASPDWPAFQAGKTSKRLLFNQGAGGASGSAMEAVPADYLARCAFWMSPEIVVQTRV